LEKPPLIAGINYSHNMSCAFLQNGEIIAAIEEERLNHVKHSDGYTKFGRIAPVKSIRYCCDKIGVKPSDVDLWVVNGIKDSALDMFKEQMVFINHDRIIGFPSPGHHLGHAYSAFIPSGFNNAAVLVADINGGRINEHTSDQEMKEGHSIYYGEGLVISEVEKQFISPGEIGVGEFYLICAALLQISPMCSGVYGKDNAHSSGGKLMGYASWFHDIKQVSNLFGAHIGFISNLPDILMDKISCNINIIDFVEYLGRFGFISGKPNNSNLQNIVGWDIQNLVEFCYNKASLSSRINVDFARNAQHMVEQYMLRLANVAYQKTGATKLCLAGGLALNVEANRRILEETGFDELYVQPAANDAGTAIGAAFYGYHHVLGHSSSYESGGGSRFEPFTGQHYSDIKIIQEIEKTVPNQFRTKHFIKHDEIITEILNILLDSGIVCLFDGESEFGPRALGHRSLIAIPKNKDVLEKINDIKKREWYRPLAPVVRERDLDRFFDAKFSSSPYMTVNARCRDITKLGAPAICHIDGTARVQTVSKEQNPFLWDILTAISNSGKELPILINTSFNIQSPIVETPCDAIKCFTEMHGRSRLLVFNGRICLYPKFREANLS
jgi:carbamoyltransferase